MTPAQAILAAFPGQDPTSLSVKLALLRVLHAIEDIELELPFAADWLNGIIDDPPWSIWYGPMAAHDLANHLENAAKEIRKAAFALDAASPTWQRFVDSTEEGNVGLGPNRERQPELIGDEAPF